MLRVVSSLLLGMLVTAALFGVGVLALRPIEARLPSAATGGFAMLVLPLAAVGGSIFVKRRHPHAPVLVMIAYFAGVLVLVGVGLLLVTALLYGVDP